MALASTLRHELLASDGFQVVAPDARVGTVEEIWLGKDGEPTGVAIRARDGRRGLVLVDDVAGLDADRRWLVVGPDAEVLELELPRIVRPADGSGRVQAAWSTNGTTLPLRPERPPRAVRTTPEAVDPPLMRSIVVLYAGVALVVLVVMALAFAVPYLVA